MDKKYWLIFGICAGVLTIVMIILVFALPPSKKESAISETKDSSIPKEGNTNLWATFPGDLKTTTFHNFGILEYADDMKSASIKSQIKLEEQTKYENFDFTNPDQIKFDAKSTFAKANDKTEIKNEKFKALSLGLFETLETLSNPKDYQQGINSIFYLIKKAFQSPDIFIRHLFSHRLSTTLKPDDIKINILKNIDTDRQDKIINGESEYCLKNALGFDHWIKLIGNDELISQANWLKDLFRLTDEEIKFIYSKEEYFNVNWIKFNGDLSKEFCEGKDFCGNEIIYKQLIDGNVVKKVLGENKNTLFDLYSEINKDYYPFESSPELFKFFEEYKKKHSEAKDYKDYTLTPEQLELLIDETSKKSLISSNYSIFFLTRLISNDAKSIATEYGIDEKLPQFIKEYIYDYLPKLFIYREFEEGQDKFEIKPLVKIHSKLAFDAIKKTYYPVSKLKLGNIFDKLFSKFVFEELQNSAMIKDMDYDEEDFCYLIVQQALDDGRKALKICHDPITAFKNINDVSKWYDPYPCIMENKTECNMTVINHLKEIVYITEEEIKKLYETYSFGKVLDKYYKTIGKSCKDKCHDDKYVMTLQFWKSTLTKDLPEGKACDYLCEIIPDEVSQPFELPYFFKQKKITEEIPQESVELFMSLNPSTDNDILSEDNYETFNKLYDFEKKFAKHLDGKGSDNFRLFELLNGIFVFDSLRTEYESIENYLQGNNKEDKNYIDYLSKGEYYYNYNPGINKTTGFNFGINLDTGDKTSVNYDSYTIDTKTLRKIIDINDLQFMNIKKIEYDYITKNNIYVAELTKNAEDLKGEKSYIDGFEYNHEYGTIYYLDKISSGLYKFTFTEEVDYQDDITCRKYILDMSGLKDNYDIISQKLNKPLTILAKKADVNFDIKDDIKEDNYICVEPNSNMVLESKINFIYSINTKNYNHLFYLLPKDTNYPMFIYNREYSVEINSFNDVFPSLKNYYSFKKTLLIVGIIIAVILCICSCFCIYKYWKNRRGRISLPSEGPDTNLINTSSNRESKEVGGDQN